MDERSRNLVAYMVGWTGPIFVVTYLIFWIFLGHNYPPPKFVEMTAQQLVDNYYLKYGMQIKIGMTVSAVIGFLYLVWGCQLATMMRDPKGEMTWYSYMELAGAILTAWVLGACPAAWMACAQYAGKMHPDIILMMHTHTWFTYDMTYMITTVQLTGLGLYTVLNREQKMFPAWAGWGAIAVGIIFIPLSFIPYLPTGPFSVAGLWNFWIVWPTWGFLFFSVYSYYILKELKQRLRDSDRSKAKEKEMAYAAQK
ncbi:MAG: hypothetical protein WC560_11475 [Syntrophales bacterium]